VDTVRREVRRKLASIGAAALGMAATLLAAYVVIVQLAGRLIALFADALILVPRGLVWIASSLETGMNGWAIASHIASAAVSAIGVPTVTVALIGLEIVAVAALFALRTLLRNEARAEESKEMVP
jgi:hypothetical protein